MPTKKPSPHPKSSTTGAKFLITAASLTAVISGWAAFSLKQPAQTNGSETATLSLPPLPTLVGRPAQANQIHQPAVDANVSSGDPAAPALRSVTIPQPGINEAPPPVTNTRSSR